MSFFVNVLAGPGRKFFRRFAPRGFAPAGEKLYRSIVAQARQPDFYVALGVPDTPDGRFDMIALHAFLVLRRLKREGAETAALAQDLFDLMFADMDQNLREMGAGDLAVGKRVKAMAKGFYGRISAYEAGLDGDDRALAEALLRNVYRRADPAPGAVAALIGYMRREDAALLARATAGLLAGDVAFGPVPLPACAPGQTEASDR